MHINDFMTTFDFQLEEFFGCHNGQDTCHQRRKPKLPHVDFFVTFWSLCSISQATELSGDRTKEERKID